MEFIYTDTIKGRVRVPVYHYSEIPYTQIMLECGESKKRNGVSYLEMPCAFDIETTNIYKRNKKGQIDNKQRPFSFMYHWQFCIGYRVIFGRTWEEFQKCLKAIEKNMNLSKKMRLVVYVHNLAFEFQHMRRFINVTDSFCKSERSPLHVVHNGCIEFRCSAALSNMSLKMFCKNENATFYKLADTYDYSKIRTADTPLTDEEKGYCYNDVRGLCECIQSLMRFDTLASIPLTSTGYVRRDARIAMKRNKKNRRMFKDSALSADEYLFMRAAFRGGDTHANARYANQVIENVTSFDITSSYPACMMIDKFPVTKFIKIADDTFEEFMRRREEFCFLLHVAFEGVRFIGQHGIPYIPLAKCKHISKEKLLDNGRIREAESLTMWVTDIDLDIIMEEYQIDVVRIGEKYASFAGDLPDEYKEVIMDYYQKKTLLKGSTSADDIYNYNKSKNRLNALFGMLCQRLDSQMTTYTGAGDTGYETTEEPLEDILVKHYKKHSSFLPYQWGVWVTANARKRLHDFYNLVGSDLIYGDTDSGKIINAERHQKAIEGLNRKLQAEAEAAGASADDRKGKRHYMGVWEYDGTYDEFKTLGAKKYVVNIKGNCYSTISGVSKDAGQKFFDEHGIDAFAVGTTIENSGHLVAYYNDDEIHEIKIDGCKMTTASNLALIDDTYTIGVTDDYAYLLERFLQGITDLG